MNEEISKSSRHYVWLKVDVPIPMKSQADAKNGVIRGWNFYFNDNISNSISIFCPRGQLKERCTSIASVCTNWCNLSEDVGTTPFAVHLFHDDSAYLCMDSIPSGSHFTITACPQTAAPLLLLLTEGVVCGTMPYSSSVVCSV